MSESQMMGSLESEYITNTRMDVGRCGWLFDLSVLLNTLSLFACRDGWMIPLIQNAQALPGEVSKNRV